MNKKDLVTELWQKFSDFRKKDLELALDLLFGRLAQALKEGERVEIRGFGRLIVKEQRPRRFKNPRTGEERDIPARKRIIFKPGKDLLERLNSPSVASLDLGTQTFRLLIAKPLDDGFRVLLRKRYNVRLGEGLSRRGEIGEEAFERGLLALKEMKEALERANVSRYLAAGTAVFRRAKNASSFLEKAAEETGLNIRVLAPEEEALFTLTGVSYGLNLDPEKTSLILDAGGGSTEFILGRKGEILSLGSLEVGAVTLTEKHLPGDDPPRRGEIEALSRAIKEGLAPLKGLPARPEILIATGGTASCLAALKLELETYCPEKLHGVTLKRAELEALFERLKALPSSERRFLKGMEPGREDIILAGLMIYLAVLDLLGLSSLTVSETGILEGLLLHLLEMGPNISAKT